MADRTRYPASRLAGLRPGDPSASPLAEDEVTVAVRVRGPADAVAAFASLTASERGAIVAGARRTRFLCFANDRYYPRGGALDYHTEVASRDAALAWCAASGRDVRSVLVLHDDGTVERLRYEVGDDGRWDLEADDCEVGAPRPPAPRTLAELRDYLAEGIAWDGAIIGFGGVEWTDLPTFGGEPVTSEHLNVVSWDPTHVLVGDERTGLTIVPRP